MLTLKLYKGEIGDFVVDIGKLSEESKSADYVVGFSIGALAALTSINDVKGKIILVSPPLPKRSMWRWLVQWIKYATLEGLFLERHKLSINPFKYIFGLIATKKLFNIDYTEILENSPPGKVMAIRGKEDRFFCDQLAADFLHSLHIKVIEVEGGHHWSEEGERAINSLIV